MTRNIGMLLLGVWLVLTGLIPLLNLSFSGLGTLMAILAVAAGVAILIGREPGQIPRLRAAKGNPPQSDRSLETWRLTAKSPRAAAAPAADGSPQDLRGRRKLRDRQRQRVSRAQSR